ncbi:BMC_2a_G0016150.mRNA.1.CDS.1 [Saccharomyces cerevisiae]|nr:BMC_2a_G0016150.mRNA.1.CDS.1 [Saccharomyces cerevisiae]CAI4435435.1 BMB_G0016150.mRNA.1.CDS.1 [Saccharomyces cerevisiae]CAI7104508.1 BMC_2a_G0016150.mRNA.1.CDS.1 [Saccharomyces cerevisiae]CAI7105994.1 BMB_G0016150.mRNA.1.CDS.1 [Saccharomyces cerevisiae]
MSLPEILPLEVIDKTINQKVLIVLQSNREFEGTLVGFDDFVNVILEDAVEWLIAPEDESRNEKVMQHHGRMLLSGNNIAILVPGGKKTPTEAL